MKEAVTPQRASYLQLRKRSVLQTCRYFMIFVEPLSKAVVMVNQFEVLRLLRAGWLNIREGTRTVLALLTRDLGK